MVMHSTNLRIEGGKLSESVMKPNLYYMLITVMGMRHTLMNTKDKIPNRIRLTVRGMKYMIL